MRSRVAILLAFAVACLGAEKKPPEGRASNNSLEMTARVFTGKDEVKRILGNDLDGYFTVIEVRLEPKSGAPLPVFREDFLLRSDKDGQRATPFHPSQIAGSAALVVSSRPGGAVRSESAGPIWGPPMGGPPVRIGNQGPTIGNSSGESAAESSTSRSGGNAGLLKILSERELPEKEISASTSGLLYFMLEGKHKTKDLELQYRGPAGKLSLRFK